MALVNHSGNLAVRALIAVALMVGFYALALGVAGGLLWLPYAEYVYFDRVSVQLALGCSVSAFMILYAVRPRRARFTPPGPRLDAAEHPGLFALIHEVAAAARQDDPHEVYLGGDVNAWVGHRGGMMGIGGQRTMGIGLPLLLSLTTRELRAVIAHEFGHYVAGDVRLGPWIYQTRAGIGRAVEDLQSDRGIIPALAGMLFELYGRLFLWLTMAVSRRQEFTADAVSARLTSPDVAARALRRVAGIGPAFAIYIEQEVQPVVNAGALPPVAIGFQRFLSAGRIQDAVAGFITAAETATESSAFDTHPPLAERLAELAAMNARATDDREGDPPASSLVGSVEVLSHQLLAFVNGEENVKSLLHVEWEDVPDRVHMVQWQNMVKALAAPLATVTVDALPVGTAAFVEMGRRLVNPGESIVDRDAAISRAVTVLTGAMIVALVEQGWTLTTAPGDHFRLSRAAHQVLPAVVIHELLNGTLAHDEWRSRCVEGGLVGMPLGAPTL